MLPAAVGLVVIVIGAIRVISSGGRLIGDRAVLALQVADIAGGQLVAVGQYSWHGWNHPGALLFYLLVPFHWLAGGDSWGIFLGVSVISAICVVLVTWLAFRRRGIAASCTGVVVLLLTWVASGRMTPVDPWTPFIAVSIFVVFMTAVWGVVERDRIAVWIMIFSGALMTQIHVGYAPLVVIIGLTALGMYWWSGGNPRAVARPMAASLLLFVPWLTDIRGAGRNLGDIAHFFVNAPESPVGFARAFRVMAYEFSPNASWLRGPKETEIIGEAPEATIWWLLLAVAGLIVTTTVTYRATHPRVGHPHIYRPDFQRLWIVAPVVWASLATAIISVSRVQGLLFPYVVLWRAIIVLIVLGWMTTVIVTVARVTRRNVLILATIAVIVAGGSSVTPVSRYDTVTGDVVVVERAIGQALSYLELNLENTSENVPGNFDDGSSLTIRLSLGDAGLVGLYPAILWELENRRIPAGIDADTAWVFGDRVLPLNQETTTWMVCDTGIGWSLLSSMPGAQIVSLVSPFTADAETRVTALQTFVAEQLRAAGRIDALAALDSPLVALALFDLIQQGVVDGDVLEELAAFNILTPRPGRRFGIVAFEPDMVPEIWWARSLF